MNRAPGPKDFWWEDHQRNCGGTFIKIKEPEPRVKPTKSKTNPNGDITNYINTNKTINNNTVLKDSNSIPDGTKSKKPPVIPKKEPVYNPRPKKPPVLFEGKGQTLNGEQTKSVNVVEEVRNVWNKKDINGSSTPKNKDDIVNTVRNVWAKKQLFKKVNNTDVLSDPRLESHDVERVHEGPPMKLRKINGYSNGGLNENNSSEREVPRYKKIDGYFDGTSILKELYGDNIKLIQSGNDNQKLVAVTNNPSTASIDKKEVDIKYVKCPICDESVIDRHINSHVDECLNIDFIEKLVHENTEGVFDGQTLGQTNTPSVTLIKQKKEPNDEITVINLEDSLDDLKNDMQPSSIIEPGPSKIDKVNECACCGKTIDTPLEEHLDECLMFFRNNTTIPEEGASTSSPIETIVIDDDDDDIFDESLALNASGTKAPCPCCLEMVEGEDMNEHLDVCLN